MSATPSDVEGWLSRIRYKPGWSFQADPSAFITAGVRIGVSFWAPDSTRNSQFDVRTDQDYDTFDGYHSKRILLDTRHTVQHQVIRVGSTFEVPSYITSEARFFDWFKRAVISGLEDHERDEWLRVDGELVHDPHASDR